MSALIGVLLAAGCDKPGKITAVTVPNATCVGQTCGVARLDLATVQVQGEGVCEEFKVSLGNGSFPLVEKNYDFSKNGPKQYRLTFETGWPGPKTITAEGVTKCIGKATTLHHVFTNSGDLSEIYEVGMNQPRQRCYGVPSPGAPLPPLRPNTMVRVTGALNPQVDFGCTFGCIYDPDGKPGSAAGGGFPFPGLREYSLILVVGNQIVQGGTAATFTTNQTGQLLLCVNDDNPTDNNGGWRLNIFVDESQAR